MIQSLVNDGIATIALNDPARRNVLSRDMFTALEEALDSVSEHDEARVVLLRGEGKVFCAGFDLDAVVADPPLMASFITRLSDVLQALRRMPQPVVAAVQGAAIAGGCAILSACDFVVVEAGARVGYPVHRIGVSPAVTLPTLLQAVPPGAARALVLGGDLIDGREAHRIGLASHVFEGNEAVSKAALELARTLASYPPGAMRVTKAWLNELDGSLDAERFHRPAAASAALANEPEAVAMLKRAWRGRSG